MCLLCLKGFVFATYINMEKVGMQFDIFLPTYNEKKIFRGCKWVTHGPLETEEVHP